MTVLRLKRKEFNEYFNEVLFTDSLVHFGGGPETFAHRFYVLVLFFSVLVIPKCGRLSWPALWSTFGRTIK